MAHRPESLTFTFPTDTPHGGIPLGNGNFGVLAWGAEDRFRLILNRQDYWNHRGRIVWGESVSYRSLKERILGMPEETYLPEFIRREPSDDAPHPCRMPLGRVELDLPESPRSSRLETRSGIAFLNGSVPLVVDPADARLHVAGRFPGFQMKPAVGEEVAAYWERHGIPQPRSFREGDCAGWTQSGVAGETLCVAALQQADQLVVVAEYGKDHDHAVQRARSALDGAPPFDEAAKRSEQFYADWWSRVPGIRLGADHLQQAWDYAMFKVSGMCREGSPAPTLQGPWVEDDRLAPWQADYHFNINVQMAHWPLLMGGQAGQYEPLIRQMREWMPLMRDYARRFAGVDEGVMLPHGANDRGGLADTSWKCQFDAGSAPWIALMLWDWFRYTGDREVLAEVIFPMLTGSVRLYEAMINESPDQNTFWGPSPEYNDPGITAWSANPSFHLALLHRLVPTVAAAAGVLGREPPELARWQALLSRMPRATVENGEIAIGQGIMLEQSHRHHSHLAGIYPIEVFDPRGADAELVEKSIHRWSRMGSGQWVGWSMPWAAKIWTRLGEPLGAGHCLDQCVRFFMHRNYFGTHNAFHRGFTSWWDLKAPYIMQMDVTAGYASAVMDSLAQAVGQAAPAGPQVPPQFGETAFEGIHLPGGQSVSGRSDANGRLVD